MLPVIHIFPTRNYPPYIVRTAALSNLITENDNRGSKIKINSVFSPLFSIYTESTVMAGLKLNFHNSSRVVIHKFDAISKLFFLFFSYIHFLIIIPAFDILSFFFPFIHFLFTALFFFPTNDPFTLYSGNGTFQRRCWMKRTAVTGVSQLQFTSNQA